MLLNELENRRRNEFCTKENLDRQEMERIGERREEREIIRDRQPFSSLFPSYLSSLLKSLLTLPVFAQLCIRENRMRWTVSKAPRKEC